MRGSVIVGFQCTWNKIFANVCRTNAAGFKLKIDGMHFQSCHYLVFFPIIYMNMCYDVCFCVGGFELVLFFECKLYG